MGKIFRLVFGTHQGYGGFTRTLANVQTDLLEKASKPIYLMTSIGIPSLNGHSSLAMACTEPITMFQWVKYKKSRSNQKWHL